MNRRFNRPVAGRAAALLGLVLAAAGSLAAQPGVAKSFDTDQMIVKYRNSGVTAAQMQGASAATAVATVQAQRLAQVQSVISRFGLNAVVKRTNSSGAQVIKLDKRQSVETVRAIAAQIANGDPNVEFAEPDRMMHPMAAAPNDSSWSSQWDLQNGVAGINAPAAWDLSTGSGVTVAVLDTGYRPHADLAANIVAGGGYDMISDATVSRKTGGRQANALDAGDWQGVKECAQSGPGSEASDSSWHGTHVAGTIAALTNNAKGVAGIAYNAKILPVRVLGHCGGYTSDIADAMIWASGGTVAGVPANTTPARVINMSLGGEGACDNTTQAAINTARANGTVVVVAAGNESSDASTSNPANCSGVVTVAAYGPDGGRAYYSNYGSIVALAGPGGSMHSATDTNGILSTLNAGKTTPGADSYAYYQGTSMATPHVAGVAALMIAAKPSLTPDQVASLLKSSARPFVASCSGCGAGMLDAFAAVKAAKGDVPPGGDKAIAEVEPNDSFSSSQVIAKAATINGTIGSSTDVDYYSLQLPAGATLSVTLTPNSSSDYDVYVYNSVQSEIGSSTNGTGKVDSVSVTNTGSSTYTRYVAVSRYSGGTGSTNGKYTLKLSW
ncbi:S8 family peptidase [Chitinimonas sp.]|uniref:S8 family peptidase n=1 Tax=Chitinimonas sp. TaxID=1934313 RepID=UPI0035B3A601